MRSSVAIGRISLLYLTGYINIVHGSVLLFNGHQTAVFPTDTPQECLAAFNTSLSCDSTVQLLNKQTDWVGWNATNLNALCVSDCRTSLVSLQNAVDTGCASWAGGALGSGTFNATTMMEFLLYKYDMSCLADGSTFCEIQKADWDIPSMVSAGKATWPTHTAKAYYDWYS